MKAREIANHVAVLEHANKLSENANKLNVHYALAVNVDTLGNMHIRSIYSGSVFEAYDWICSVYYDGKYSQCEERYFIVDDDELTDRFFDAEDYDD